MLVLESLAVNSSTCALERVAPMAARAFCATAAYGGSRVDGLFKWCSSYRATSASSRSSTRGARWSKERGSLRLHLVWLTTEKKSSRESWEEMLGRGGLGSVHRRRAFLSVCGVPLSARLASQRELGGQVCGDCGAGAGGEVG